MHDGVGKFVMSTPNGYGFIWITNTLYCPDPTDKDELLKYTRHRKVEIRVG